MTILRRLYARLHRGCVPARAPVRTPMTAQLRSRGGVVATWATEAYDGWPARRICVPVLIPRAIVDRTKISAALCPPEYGQRVFTLISFNVPAQVAEYHEVTSTEDQS